MMTWINVHEEVH